MSIFLMLIAAVLFLSIIVSGAVIVVVISNKKWGYTKEREHELEEGRHD